MKYPDAGINPAKSGLTARAGLYFNAGLHDKGDGFNLQDLDPYLLFDAETSMLGNLENPTLDLDPATPDTLDVITATRAGIATFTAADGQIVVADENTVRVDWSLGYPAMLIEPSATNLVPSNDFYAVTTTLITSGFEAPDGSNDAIEISNILDADGDRAHTNIATIAGSTQYAGSLYVKGTAGEVISFFTKRYSAGAYSTSSEKEVLLTGDWQRVTDMLWTSSSDNTQGVIVVNKRPTTTADVIQVWGPQIELGSVSTSVIPTSGSAGVRNADNLVIDGTAFSDFYNATEGTFYIEAVHRTPTIRCGYLTGQSTNQMFLYQNNGDNAILMFDGASSGYIGNTPADELFRAAVTYNATDKQLSLNGVDSSVISHNGNWGIATELNVGQGPSSAYPAMNGYLKRVIYWPTHSSGL